MSDDLAYGYAAVNIAGGSESSWCCACYELTFTSGPVAGKKMVVQATNTGGDLSGNQFDISMPGGGVGIFNGCTQEWGAPSSGWGAQYGGISAASSCAGFPAALQAGCQWRFDWFQVSIPLPILLRSRDSEENPELTSLGRRQPNCLLQASCLPSSHHREEWLYPSRRLVCTQGRCRKWYCRGGLVFSRRSSNSSCNFKRYSGSC